MENLKRMCCIVLSIAVLISSYTVPVCAEELSPEYVDSNQATRTIIKPKKLKVIDIRKAKVVFMHSGEQLRFTAGGKATWKSAKKSVLSIDQKGVATVKDFGVYAMKYSQESEAHDYDVRVTAKRNGKTYSCFVRAFPLFIDTPGYWFSSVNKTVYIDVLKHGIDFPHPGVEYVYSEDDIKYYAEEKMTISAKSSNPSVIKIETPKGSVYGIRCKVKKEGEAVITVTMKTPAGYTHIFKQRIRTLKKSKNSFVEGLYKQWMKTSYRSLTQEEAYSKIMEFSREKYPEGSKWTASHRYLSTYGTLGFANMLSNYIFGGECLKDGSDGSEEWEYKNKSWEFKIEDNAPLRWDGYCHVYPKHADFHNPIEKEYDMDELRTGDIVLFNDLDNPGEINRCAVLISRDVIDEETVFYHFAEGDAKGKVTYQTVLNEQEMDKLFNYAYSRY